MLAALLTDFKDALMTGCAGTTRPNQLQPGGMWIDTSLQAAPTYYWIYKLWTGTVDVEVFRLNINSGYGGALTAEALFEVQQISADTVGAIQEIIKNRFEDSGQVLSGDTVGEIQFVGRTITSTDPTVGYIKWQATDDQGASEFGGTLSFYSTPDASNVILEHLRFIQGLVEVQVPLLANCLRLVSQDIGTASTIVQLSAAKPVVEFTGSTPTDVQGINSGHDSKVVTIHNRSTANVVLKHQNSSAAAADRLDLLGDEDYTIEPEGTATLVYLGSALRWKLQSTHRIGASSEREVITGPTEWTAPADVESITVTVMKKKKRVWQYGFMDQYGSLYAWSRPGGGYGEWGDMGHGAQGFPGAMRSSPVAVLGGIQWASLAVKQIGNTFGSSYGIDVNGIAYAWGLNDSGQLGVGNVVNRSSPVAVLGGLRFRKIYMGEGSAYALTADGSAYAWGLNDSGNLGVGDVTPRSSPVAVLGGLKFADLAISQPANFPTDPGSVLGLTVDGLLYAWGQNGNGEAGVGDVTPRSSPVAVIGVAGEVFVKIGVKSRFDSNAPTFYALAKSGNLYAWGDNATGCVGDTTRLDRSSPILVTGGATAYENFWVLPSIGIIAKGRDKSLWAWGGGGTGGGFQLGLGSNIQVSSPVACVALAGFDFEDIESAGPAIFGLHNGQYYSWGGSGSSPGTGVTSTHSSPLAVLGNIADIQVGSPQRDAIGFAPDGRVYTWGNDFAGGLGHGTADVDTSSPVLIAGFMGANPTYDTDAITIDVTPSETYEVVFGKGRLGYFGETPLGFDVDRITIDYTKRGNA